jgi:hypothetical protein
MAVVLVEDIMPEALLVDLEGERVAMLVLYQHQPLH